MEALLLLVEQVRHQVDHLHAHRVGVHGRDLGRLAKHGAAGARHAEPRRRRHVGVEVAVLEAHKGVDAEHAGGEADGVHIFGREVLDLAVEFAEGHVEVGAAVVEGLLVRVVGLLGAVQRGQQEQGVEEGIALEGELGDDVYPEGVGGFVYGDGGPCFGEVLVEEGEF